MEEKSRSRAPPRTPAIGSAGATIGQSGPIGISTGPTSGITLHAGFWPIAASDAELLDSDGDGIPDASDNCIEEENASQLDTDGDDYGNACDCDFDQNLACNIADFSIFREDYIATVDSGVGTDMDGNGAWESPTSACSGRDTSPARRGHRDWCRRTGATEGRAPHASMAASVWREVRGLEAESRGGDPTLH